MKDGLEYRLNKKERTASVCCDEVYSSTLEEAIIPAVLTVKGVDYTVNYIPLEGFEWCSNLRKIVIPNTIDRLLRSTFEHCLNLEYIEIPSSVKIFLPNLFYGCKSLKKIVYENLKESNSNTEGFNLNEEVFNGCNPDVILEDRATGKEYKIEDLTQL